jgi:hypothetical protein
MNSNRSVKAEEAMGCPQLRDAITSVGLELKQPKLGSQENEHQRLKILIIRPHLDELQITCEN